MPPPFLQLTPNLRYNFGFNNLPEPIQGCNRPRVRESLRVPLKKLLSDSFSFNTFPPKIDTRRLISLGLHIKGSLVMGIEFLILRLLSLFVQLNHPEQPNQPDNPDHSSRPASHLRGPAYLRELDKVDARGVIKAKRFTLMIGRFGNSPMLYLTALIPC